MKHPTVPLLDSTLRALNNNFLSTHRKTKNKYYFV